MDLNEYVLEMLVREKLRDARATSARQALVVGRRPPRPTVRARVGIALVALGERLAGAPAPRPSCANPSAGHG
jgi:hypothetical protein